MQFRKQGSSKNISYGLSFLIKPATGVMPFRRACYPTANKPFRKPGHLRVPDSLSGCRPPSETPIGGTA